MGYSLPSPTSPVEHARALMARKDVIEAELGAQAAILTANGTNMQEPLVDREGFPRADIDVWAVRHARVRVIELRNDLSALMGEIGKALESVYDPALAAPAGEHADEEARDALRPFAKVNAVAPGSPAADAVRIRPPYPPRRLRLTALLMSGVV